MPESENPWWAKMTPEEIAKKDGCSFCDRLRINRGGSNEVTADSQNWIVLDLRIGRGKASFHRRLKGCPSCHDKLVEEVRRLTQMNRESKKVE